MHDAAKRAFEFLAKHFPVSWPFRFTVAIWIEVLDAATKRFQRHSVLEVSFTTSDLVTFREVPSYKYNGTIQGPGGYPGALWRVTRNMLPALTLRRAGYF